MRALSSLSDVATKYVDWPTNAMRRRPPAGGAGYGMPLASKESPRRGRLVTVAGMRPIMQARSHGYASCMPDWQERITRENAPALGVGQELRLGLAAPLIAEAALWGGVGGGSGVGAGRGLADSTAERTLLVDVAAGALEQAARELPGNVSTLQADLATEDAVSRV